MMHPSRAKRTGLLFFTFIFLMGASNFDMYEESGKIWDWHPPKSYPPRWFEGMKIETLSAILDSGNLEWYEPRPEDDTWDAVVGAKFHATPEQVWKVLTDYNAPCRIMQKTFMSCKSERTGECEVINHYDIRITVLEFATDFPIVDVVKEDHANYRQRIKTIEGGLKGRELDIILKPVDGGKSTIMFMRYYAHMKSLGLSMQAVLAMVPMAEYPVTAASANYHSRSIGREAERLAGYKPPPAPVPINYAALDFDTLRTLAGKQAGLIRETSENKTIEGVAFSFIKAPADIIYHLITDFENYNKNFGNQETKVLSREGNQVRVYQKTLSQSVLVFTFGYEMENLYTLDPPYHISSHAVGGSFKDSTGDFRILPLPGGKECAVFCATGLAYENDSSLTTKIIRSGDFPFNNVMDLEASRTFINSLKPVAEARARGQASTP